MAVCLSVCPYDYVFVCEFIFLAVYISLIVFRVPLFLSICVSINRCIHVYARKCVSAYMFTYLYVYKSLFVCFYMSVSVCDLIKHRIVKHLHVLIYDVAHREKNTLR